MSGAGTLRMEPDEVLRRVLTLAGISQKELARQLDVSQATVSKWISSVQKPAKRQWAAVIKMIEEDARLAMLRENVRQNRAPSPQKGALTTITIPSDVSSIGTVLVRGVVGAGGIVIRMDEYGQGTSIWRVEAPWGAPPDIRAYVVRGRWAYGRYDDGEILYATENQENPHEFIGMECIVELKGGDLLLGVLRSGNGHTYSVDPPNSPPHLDVEVHRAMPIQWTRRNIKPHV